jgi:N-acetylglucosaminyldiphosphoundecaprenol N-acetyl-beta-D-mannosaminyltransferase
VYHKTASRVIRCALRILLRLSRVRTYEVLGTPLTATTYEELTRHCQKLARAQATSAIDLTNTQVVTMRRHEAWFAEMTSAFEHFVPDGMPLIWCLNRRGAQLRDRVYGPTFMRYCVIHSPESFTHYFLGGSEECLARLKLRFTSLNASIRIVGTHHGYFSPEEEERIVGEINQLSPDFVWVGLGTPKQQAWIHRNKPRIRRGVLFAIGFAFDVNAGLKPDAPTWMQKAGLTWIYRIVTEPRRLLARYLRYNSLFIFYVAKDAITRRRAHGRSRSRS